MRFTRQGDLYVIRFEDGEVFPGRLLEFLATRSIFSGTFTGIGAMSRVRLAYFDTSIRAYADLDVEEQVEVLALVGNVARHSEQPLVHAHITLGRRDYSTLGGHLREGVVCPTLELYLRAGSETIERTVDERYGLPSLELEESF